MAMDVIEQTEEPLNVVFALDKSFKQMSILMAGRQSNGIKQSQEGVSIISVSRHVEYCIVASAALVIKRTCSYSKLANDDMILEEIDSVGEHDGYEMEPRF